MACGELLLAWEWGLRHASPDREGLTNTGYGRSVLEQGSLSHSRQTWRTTGT